MRRLLAVTFAAALIVPLAAPAQQPMKERELLYIETMDVDPVHSEKFEAAVGKIVAAAKKANVSGNYRWMFTQHGDKYTLVFPFKGMSYWDDPEQWMRQFKGAEAELKAIMTEMETTPVRSTSAIVEAVPEWRYIPAAAPAQANFVHIIVEHIKPGKDKDYDAVSKEAIAMVKSINYPYQLHGHKVVFGDMVERVWVIPYDDPAKFYGPNSFWALLEKHGKMAAWQALEKRSKETVEDMSYHDEMIKLGMTYWVPLAQAAAR